MPDDVAQVESDEQRFAEILTGMGVEPYLSGGKWQMALTDVQMVALLRRVASDERERVAAYLEGEATRLRDEGAGTPHAVQAVLDAGLLDDVAGWCRDDSIWSGGGVDHVRRD